MSAFRLFEIWMWRLLTTLTLSATLAGAAQGAAKTIVVDGDASEWDAGDLLYEDTDISDGEPVASSYAAVYVANDDDYLYLGLETKGAGGGDIYNPWIHHIYVDTDQDPGTGFNDGGWSGGYDRLILYGDVAFEEFVYAFDGADQATGQWDYLAHCENASTDSFIEIAVPLKNLGMAVGGIARIQLIVSGNGVTTETWAHADEARAGSYTLVEPASRTIILDGDLSDWGPEYVFYNDAEITDGEPENSTYREIFVANDADSLYLGFDVKGSGGGEFTNSWVRQVYIDSDDDPTTGFNGGWMTHGYDRLVEFGAGGSAASIFSFAGVTQDEWAWGELGPINYGYSDSVVEWGFPTTTLGMGTNQQVVLEFSVTGQSIVTPTWAHLNEGEARTYAFTTSVVQPIIDDFSITGGMVHLGISDLVVGRTNDVERATTLEPSNWSGNTSFEASGSTTNWSAPLGEGAIEFFRVNSAPP